MSPEEKFRNRLAGLMKEQSVSVEKLSERSGVELEVIEGLVESRIGIKEVNAAKIMELAEALDVSASFLVTGAINAPPGAWDVKDRFKDL